MPKTATPVLIPLLNPNEPEAVLAGLHVSNGQRVETGDLLCTLETTKSTAELRAETGGFVAGLSLEAGATVQAGETLLFLAASPDWTPPAAPAVPNVSSPGVAAPIPDGLRITRPALALARSRGLDLSLLPLGPLVTEATIHSLTGETAPPAAPVTSAPFDPTALLIYGGGGHGKSLIELVRALHAYRIIGIVDDGLPPGQEILGLPTLGGSQALADLFARGVRLAVNAVGGIGRVEIRLKVFEKLAAAGFACPALVHPSAWVEPSAVLAPGVQVFPHAYVGPDASIGFGSIVNTGAIVSHDCRLGQVVNLAPGAILAGEVEVGEAALIGMGVTVNLRVKIGAHARIGNGATVKQDVPAGAVVKAGMIWP
jgi:sugar O-acyltransferase (sialic acid O-acetyltransferase NeuD family)